MATTTVLGKRAYFHTVKFRRAYPAAKAFLAKQPRKPRETEATR